MPTMKTSRVGVALIPFALLLVPAIAMHFSAEVRWGPGDFAAAGLLLFITAMAVMAALRLRRRRDRVLVAGLVVLAAATVWAELAVGLFH